MGALNPVFLVAALSVGLPIFLHLFQRHQARRISFPALRYLERTEREHARRIRFRQLLLLCLRVAALLAVVAAGARLFVRGRGGAHPPTALVLVLDNSMSSGRVVGEERVLDFLKERAIATIELAAPEDVVWVLRAGEPWLPAPPTDAAGARERVLATEVSAARGDLTAALERAAGLLATSTLEPREVHLLSDLQATAFRADAPAPAADVPVLVWSPEGPSPANGGIVEVTVGGGLPPLRGERTEVSVRVDGFGDAGGGDGRDTTYVPVRVVLDDRIRGAATIPVGSALSIPLPTTPAGWVLGWAETDPDDLRADDRRVFAFHARAAPTLALAGDAGQFLTEAAAVLEEARRVRTGDPGSADLVVAARGEGLAAAAADAAVLVVPPEEPSLLPALNRRLADEAIPWSYGPPSGAGRAPVVGERLPTPLRELTASRWYRLAPAGDAAGAPRTLAEVAGDPWLVEGLTSSGRRYLLLASPLDADASTLPVSTAMVRFVDWAAGEWASAGSDASEHLAGEPLGAPRDATHVRLPSGDVVEVDGTREVRSTGQVGFYTFLAGDSVTSVAAVNPPPAESDPTPLSRGRLGPAIGADVTVVGGDAAWRRAAFRIRQGPELWRPLVALAVLLLVAESLAAGAGRSRRAGAKRASPAPEAHAAD